MLTADLVRTSVARGVVKPRYVAVDDDAMRAEAATLVRTFQEHVGHKRGELEEAIADHIGDSPQYMVTRGLARLLWKKSTVETAAAADPEDVRRLVFQTAAARWPVGVGPTMTPREAVIAQVAEQLGVTPGAVEAALFADLEREQVITDTEPWEVDDLLHRYNLALAQGVLLKATEVRITLPEGVGAKRARQVFRMLKFHRLMHRAVKERGGYVITLDGPLSLFKQTTRYGLQLALFLPTLCHCVHWTLEADVVWGKDNKALTFVCDQDSGLVTHTRDLGTWEADEERHFKASFKAVDGPWQLRRGARLIDLNGRGVLVPDFELRHSDGRKAYLDVVWFWRKRSFLDRLELLAEAGPPNLIVALATRYNADPKGEDARLEDLGGAVYPFKGVIQPKKIIALAEEVAR